MFEGLKFFAWLGLAAVALFVMCVGLGAIPYIGKHYGWYVLLYVPVFLIAGMLCGRGFDRSIDRALDISMPPIGRVIDPTKPIVLPPPRLQ